MLQKLWIFALSCFGLTGCSGVTMPDMSPVSAQELVGQYVFRHQGSTDALTLHSNGTFKQVVTEPDGKKFSFAGKWQFGSEPNVILLGNDYCLLYVDGKIQMPSSTLSRLRSSQKASGPTLTQLRASRVRGIQLVISEDSDFNYDKKTP